MFCILTAHKFVFYKYTKLYYMKIQFLIIRLFYINITGQIKLNINICTIPNS